MYMIMGVGDSVVNKVLGKPRFKSSSHFNVIIHVFASTHQWESMAELSKVLRFTKKSGVAQLF